MDVTNTPPLTPASTAKTPTSQASAVLSSDFETFLQMLTAQARYQDPLEPIDSSEYAAQLAQFSMVEQQVQSNDLLQQLSAQLGQGNIGQMASWIGMEARSQAAVPFDGTPITVLTRSEPSAEEAILIAYGPDGSEVNRQQIPTDTTAFEWAGVAQDGSSLPAGTYSFAVESRTAGKPLSTLKAETYARITEARRDGMDTVFILEGGSALTSDGILALREAL
jgi:flagellar basal-body rod modification protein FlgD